MAVNDHLNLLYSKSPRLRSVRPGYRILCKWRQWNIDHTVFLIVEFILGHTMHKLQRRHVRYDRYLNLFTFLSNHTTLATEA